MKLSNADTDINVEIPNFKANGIEFKCVVAIDDTEKRIKIEYPFEHNFKKGKLYHITYNLQRKHIYLEDGYKSPTDIEGVTTIDCGMCRLLCVERRVNHSEMNHVTYVFKKVKGGRE